MKPRWIHVLTCLTNHACGWALREERMGVFRLGTGFAAVLYSFCFGAFVAAVAQQTSTPLPSHIPPRRASQLQEAPAGVNTSLPRMPYLPWAETWWTRIYDGGMK